MRSNIKTSLRSMHQGERGGLFDDGPVASMRWMEPIECGRLVDPDYSVIGVYSARSGGGSVVVAK
ncbi:hypothetical protein AZG88_32235 [Rhodococcus sp. LB1]|nr:hypothetical protein AZG88_32235 [Rhodococcus sp. LB1]